ncbi:hypothetical protein LSCM1_04840 [Leishmania martiniquensis]|uniref:Uncharacterized protein n=1 Tax=Leishmania martiniquensis TaxID=1580590 RepID=A0A836HVF3_9TRYP|nr:hypothetical protein LSCM1_04840 [Leishmania martiniquensis]
MSSMTAPRDAAVLAALERLEVVRERLHDTLREAAFSFTNAQREEEQTRGRLISFEAVPTAQGTLEALVSLTWKPTHASVSDSVEAPCGDSDEAALVGDNSFVWEVALVKGKRRRTQQSAAATSPPASLAPDSAEEAIRSPPDPIYYLSEHPSSALRECQEAYRRVLHCAVETVNAQQCALAAAAAMTTPSAHQL